MSFSASADYVAFFVAFKAASGGGSGGTVANPSISPVSGTYSSPQTITVSDSTSGATICVRTDGGTPTASTPGTCNSPATGYSSGGMFSLTIPSGGATVAALGTLAGDTNSNVVTNTYSLSSAAATPTFSPGAGTYSGSQSVTISTTSSGAVICWNTTGSPATNGTSGCTTGTLYSSPVTVSANETLYAVAGGTGYSNSTVSSAAYQINPSGPTVYYYIQDSLGTTRMMTDSSGTVCYDADFYPFGGERPFVDSCPQNYKFTGKERDSESNLDNFDARYDSSSMGRFMSPDPIGGRRVDPQTLNKYSYVRNNPLTLTDPTGMYDCGDSTETSKCGSEQDKAFANSLLQALHSGDAQAVLAAYAYGTANDGNGVTVSFADKVDKYNDNGLTTNLAGTNGFTYNAQSNTFQQATQVTIRKGLTSPTSDDPQNHALEETVVHEGVHVEDRAKFISTFRQGNDPNGDMGFHADYLLNITGKQSEVNAFGVQNQLRRTFGEEPLDIGAILSRPPYSKNPTLNQPIIPAVTAPQ